MAYTTPTIDEFKIQFARDFAFNIPANMTGDDSSLDKVRGVDITNAQLQAAIVVNPGLIESQALFSFWMNVVTAHFLATNIQASSQGLGSAASWLTASKAVGEIREAYLVPKKVRESVLLSGLMQTQYGKQFVVAMSARLIGNIQIVPGTTLP